MSKPAYWPVVAPLKPSPGWSSLTPITPRPRCEILSNVGEPATWTPVAAGSLTAAPPPPGLPSLPHAVRDRAPTTSPIARVRHFICVLHLVLSHVRRRNPCLGKSSRKLTGSRR